MKILKSVYTRIIAFAAALALVIICAFRYIDLLKSHEKLIHRSYGYLSGYEYENSVNELYAKLWITGNMYLKYLDGNGDFTGNEFHEESVRTQLYENGITDYNGNFTFADDTNLEYCVMYGDSVLSNVKDMTAHELKEYFEADAYSFVYKDGYISRLGIGQDVWSDDYNWYSTNYGMYYYNCGEYSSAVFDFDTSGLDYYSDSNGARIYYKTDGTTPIPFTDEYDYYIEGEPVTGAETEMHGEPEDSEFKEGFLFYDADEGKWIRVNNDSFITIPGDSRPLTIYIRPDRIFIEEYECAQLQYSAEKDYFVKNATSLIPFAAVVLILTIFVLFADGYSIKNGGYILRRADKIFAEIPFVLMAAGIAAAIVLLDPDTALGLYNETEEYIGGKALTACYCIAYAGLYTVVTGLICTLLRRLKCHCFWKTTFVGNTAMKLFAACKKAKEKLLSREILRNDLFTRRFVVRTALFIAAAVAVGIFSVLSYTAEIFVVCAILLAALYIFLSLMDLKEIRKLNEHISAISEGDYTKREENKKLPSYGMTHKLNNISDGIQRVVEKRINSERMKIDLVTNVSHDLKTPLTSIISYVNLLSMEELTPEARDYVKILENKTERLKAIVSDLFDLAKATSNTDIKLELIDAVILTGQVLADMNDKIDSFGREFRIDISMESAPIYAEGKKLYRVMQNLIDNALKYSLENTRIYLSLHEEKGNAVITVKNISAYEMKFTPEEITERFTRGDESRSSEGNGLGLSIAKSFTEACGGEFRIIVDGDVFVAEVRIPIVTTEIENGTNE